MASQRSAAPPALVRAAEAYEELFVPALFGEWAPRVTSAARVGPGDRVLDVACGTGVVAREARARVGSSGFVAGLDPHAGMIEVATRLGGAIEYREAAAESLPFADASFDAALCQFGLMFFTDKVGALREIRRVLTPSGRFAFAVWNVLEAAPAFAALARVLDEVVGADAANALHVPFSMGDPRELLELFTTAGLSPATLTTQAGTARFPSPHVMVKVEIEGWLPVMGVQLDDAQKQRVHAAAEQELAPWVLPDGKIVSPVSAHIVSTRVAS